MDLTWRLNVWAPIGSGPTVIQRDSSYITSTGLRMQLTPNGDCREATFTAQGAGIQLPSLSAVQFEYFYGGVWTALWYGEVRVGGNAHDLYGETYTLRSLALSLKETILPAGFKTPKQAAHLTIQAAISAAVSSGRLGTPSLILYDAARCPPLGFDCRAIVNANQQTVYALLEQVRQDGVGLGVNAVFGVGPDRTFFFEPARTAISVLDALPTGVIQYKPPVAETVCTSVLWYILKKPDGTWLTYESTAPEATLYRPRTVTQSVDAAAVIWDVAPFDAYANDGSGEVPLTGAAKAAFTDSYIISGYSGGTTFSGAPDPASSNWSAGLGVEVQGASETAEVNVRVLYPQGALRLIRQIRFINGDPDSRRLTIQPPGGAAAITLTGNDAGSWVSRTGTASLQAAMTPHVVDYQIPPGSTVTIHAAPLATAPTGQRAVTIAVDELRPEVPSAQLDALAMSFFHTPSTDPADIELLSYLTPAQLGGRVTLGSYQSPVDAWEYRLSVAHGLTLGVLSGQAEDPARLAQAALIKARDGKAVITAITAQR
jgi:hypothetical protein